MTSHPISPSLHLTVIVILAILVGVALVRGAGGPPERARAMGLGILTLWLAYNAYYFYPANFSWDTSLPLHVCDVLGAISAWALIASNRSARALLYFCALPLAGQALLTPTGNQDPLTLRFWLYWLLHGGIVLASLYDLIVRQFRPAASDLRTVLVWGAAYVAVIVPINVATGWNYGYLGDAKPDVATGLDLFGPWPGRIVPMVAAVASIQTAMYLPWPVWRLVRLRRLKGRREERC